MSGMAYQSNLGRNVRTFRSLRRWTLKDLAQVSGVDTGTLSRLERGEAGPSAENVQKLCKAFGISEGVLFSDDPHEESHKHRFHSVPILDASQVSAFAAGRLATTADSAASSVPVGYGYSKSTFALQGLVEGMQTVFSDTDYLIIDPEVAPKPGDFVVALNGPTVVFRQFRLTGQGDGMTFDLVPLNSFYPTIRSSDPGVHLIGTMVEHRVHRKRG